MSFKTFWKENFIVFILKRIVFALILFFIFAWVTLLLIDQYTHHGESVRVPDLQGLFVEEAQNILQQYDLEVQVIDSVYDKDMPLGTIVEQIPSVNSLVKKNRSIFLIVNKMQKRLVSLPNVIDVSYRQADALINSLGLKIASVEYRPSEFKDLVIDVRYNDVPVTSGTKLPEGSSLVLIIGSGFGESNSVVPTLIGKNMREAKNLAIESSFVIGAVNYDVTPVDDEDSYYVYKQSPDDGDSMPIGSRINIWLTKDEYLIEKVIESQLDQQEEEFF